MFEGRISLSFSNGEKCRMDNSRTRWDRDLFGESGEATFNEGKKKQPYANRPKKRLENSERNNRGSKRGNLPSG